MDVKKLVSEVANNIAGVNKNFGNFVTSMETVLWAETKLEDYDGGFKPALPIQKGIATRQATQKI